MGCGVGLLATRRQIAGGGRDLWMKGVLPFLGGTMLLGAFIFASIQYAQPDYGNTTLFGIGGVFVVGIGALLVGVILMVFARLVQPGFFRGETLARRGAHDLLLAGAPRGIAGGPEGLRLPDSGLPEIVIAPDLSNLPHGATAIDPETGEEYKQH